MLFSTCFRFPSQILIVFFILTFLYILNLSAESLPDTLGYKRLTVKKGDRCLICDMTLKKGTGLALLIKGSRVTIDLDHLQELLSDKDFYISKLQPKGALFQESAVLKKTLRSGWFIFGSWVVLSLVIAALSCQLALKKGYNPLQWFFIGLFFNLFGYLWFLFQKRQTDQKAPEVWTKIPLTLSPRYCSRCGTSNHPAAEKCIRCHLELSPDFESEVKRADSQ